MAMTQLASPLNSIPLWLLFVNIFLVPCTVNSVDHSNVLINRISLMVQSVGVAVTTLCGFEYCMHSECSWES